MTISEFSENNFGVEEIASFEFSDSELVVKDCDSYEQYSLKCQVCGYKPISRLEYKKVREILEYIIW